MSKWNESIGDTDYVEINKQSNSADPWKFRGESKTCNIWLNVSDDG